jgi:hypothetical protein
MSARTHLYVLHLSGLSLSPIRGIARAIIWAATAGALGICSALPTGAPGLLTPANAQQGNEQRALITVRDVSGLKGAPVPLSLQVHAPIPPGTLVTVHVGDVPKGASLSDGSRTAIAAKERDLIDVTGWNLANTTFTMPWDVTGEFTLAAVVTVENGVRPLFIQATFLVKIGHDRSLTSGPVRTVQAEVGPSQNAVRTTLERKAEQAQGPRVPAPGQDGSLQGAKSAMDRLRDAMVENLQPPRAAAVAPHAVPRDPVAEAIAADRKVWLELERTRTETLTRQLVAAHEQIGELRAKVDPPGSDSPELKDAELSRLLSKANELIRPGDVSGARLLLERALETGSAEAAFYLAQTYDPRILDSWNVQGISADAEKARALYQRAHEGGLTKAKELVELMR